MTVKPVSAAPSATRGDLFSALTIGPVTLPNRVIRPGANEMMTRDGLPTRALVAFHRRLAEGGVGMTTLAYIAVSRDRRTFAGQGVLDARSVLHYRAVTGAVHAAGARASAQITHAGSFVQHRELSARRAMSASSGIDKMGMLMGRFLQRAMTPDDMRAVCGAFVDAARHAAAAGFDAVELHMGHGYLPNQFISPLSNRRRDAYGARPRRASAFRRRCLRPSRTWSAAGWRCWPRSTCSMVRMAVQRWPTRS